MEQPAPLVRLYRRLVQAWRERAVVLKAASFASIGVINALVDLAVFFAAYKIVGMALIPANVLAWLVAVTGSYVMNSFVTFAAESGRQLRWRAYLAFVASGIAGLIANTTTLVVASYWVPVLAAKLMAMVVSFLVNFSLSNFLVFRARERGADRSAE